MAKINLLPWRDEYRAEKQREFTVVLGFFAAVGVGIALLWIQTVNSQIDNQNSRNSKLKGAITELDKKVSEIDILKKRREEMIERMRVIQDLQGKRPVIVRQFDEMVRTLPDGVYFNDLKREGDKISFSGVAESPNRVSSLMRQLDESDWFSEPNLTKVDKKPEEGEQANAFQMTVNASEPKPADAEAEEGGV